MHILTNFPRFPETWQVASGMHGTAAHTRTFEQFRSAMPEADLLLINCDLQLAWRLAARAFIPGIVHRPIVAVDLVLRRPATLQSRLLTPLKKLLLTRIDHFINYFRFSEGYVQHYGITPERSSFVEFKPNLRPAQPGQFDPDGDYILCIGRSHRDFDTFFEAVQRLPYPAAVPRPDFASLRESLARFTWPLDRLPPNVTLLDDDGSEQSMVNALRRARIVVLPLLASSTVAGNSMYLNAMYAHKCVIVSQGPGVTDVLAPDVAVQVAPENASALADAISHVWEDDALRRRIADAGHRYALSLGGEPELYQRVLEATMTWYSQAKLHRKQP